MVTPRAWHDAAKRALEGQNARITPEYTVERRDSAGNVAEVHLLEVSLVREPPHPNWTLKRVEDPDQEQGP